MNAGKKATKDMRVKWVCRGGHKLILRIIKCT